MRLVLAFGVLLILFVSCMARADGQEVEGGKDYTVAGVGPTPPDVGTGLKP